MRSWTIDSALTAWHLDLVGLILAAVLLPGLKWCSTRWRQAIYLLVGIGSLLYVTCGPIGTYDRVLLWCLGAKVATLTAVTPFGLAVGLGGRPLPFGGRALRVICYPGLTSLLAALSVGAVFFTGYGQAASTHPLVGALLVAHLFIIGLMVTAPLVVGDLLPDWATPAVRTVIACVDGLFDALPGILVMTSNSLLLPHFPGFGDPARGATSPSLDQKWAGGALIAVAEVVGLPLLLAVFLDWIRHDEAEAQRVDAELDAIEGDGLWWVTGTSDRSTRSG
ncbi:cytochrome c oxidase assembly protein [Calidifontibacter terrae]